MCMASPRGTVSGNADLPGRTRERALPAPLLPGEKAENRGKAPGYFPQQRRPLGPDKAAGTARLGLPRGGKGFYVSSVIMLLGPPGTIPRRACCGRCIYDSGKYKKPLRAFIELWTILNEIFYTTFQNTADPGENIQIQLFNIIVVPFIDDGKACTNAGCQFVARDIAVMEDLL